MADVLIFKETLLPPSETFILAQMEALQRYRPTLVGLERVEPSLPLPEDTLVLSQRPSALAGLRAKVYRRTGWAPLFHRAAGRRRASLIHAHFATGGRTALAMARALKVPLVVTLHGADITVRPRESGGYRQLGKQAAHYLCVSEFIRECALEAGLPREKLSVLYTGINRTQFTVAPPNESSQQVLFVGRLVEKKGCEVLLRAMQIVQHRHAGSELRVIGDGPLRAELQSLAESLGLRCTFAGRQPPTQIRETLRQTRIFCVPSMRSRDGDSEGLGMVFAEAEAMGIPVVSTLHGGIPEVVVNGETGLLVPERDVEGLAGAIDRLLADRALWERFHVAGPAQVARQFDLRSQTVLLEELYDRFARKVV